MGRVSACARLLYGAAAQIAGRAWPELMQLAALANGMGMSTWLVGGLVRDAVGRALVGVPARPMRPVGADIDLVVEGQAMSLCHAAVARFGGQVATPRNVFLTARWRAPSGACVDLATARTETYGAPAALPNVTAAALQQDLARRDFSIHAMALPLRLATDDASLVADDASLVDPFGGVDDCRRRTLRILHAQSFVDDPTRMLRAARYAARLGFGLAEPTAVALQRAVAQGALARLSAVRRGRALGHVWAEPEVVEAARLLHRWGFFASLGWPCLHAEKVVPAIGRSCRARYDLDMCAAVLPPQADVVWQALAMHLPEPVRRHAAVCVAAGAGPGACARWLRGGLHIDAVHQALAEGNRQACYARLAQLDAVERVCLYAQINGGPHRDLLRWWERHGRRVRSVVTGATLQALGYSPGPAMRPALAAALHTARCGGGAQQQVAAAVAAMGQQILF